MKLLIDYYQDDTYFYRSETNLDKSFAGFKRQSEHNGTIGKERVLWIHKTDNSVIIVTDSDGFGQRIHVHVFRLVEKLEHPLEAECPECGEEQADCDCVFCKGCKGIAAESALCLICKSCAECCECPVCNSCSEQAQTVCERCENCQECCSCAYCGNCGPCEYTCSNCDRCGDCCNCFSCELCGEPFNTNHICRTCNRCGDCCSCDDGERNIPSDGERTGPRKEQKLKFFKPVNLLGFKSLKIRRPISVELELSSVPKQTPLVDWAKNTQAGLVKDGSIPHKGCEINTNPASGDEHVKMMQTLSEALVKSKAEVNDSCGLHVHVDATDVSQFDLRKLMMFWTAIEPSIFEMVSKTRYGNQYCQPVGSGYAKLLTELNKYAGWNQRIAEHLYKCANSNVKEEKREKYHDSRYGALNLHSYFYRKTIEFRLHEARLEPHILLHWPILCAAIVDHCQKQTEKNLLTLIRSDVSSEAILAEALPNITRLWMEDRLESRREARKKHATDRACESFLASLFEGRKLLAENGLAPVGSKVSKVSKSKIIIAGGN